MPGESPHWRGDCNTEGEGFLCTEARWTMAAAEAGAKKVHGVVYVNATRCKGCGYCIAFCPPKVLEFSDELNRAGYHPPHLSNPDGCTGCDLCGLYCPDFAIYGVMIKSNSQPAKAEAEAES